MAKKTSSGLVAFVKKHIGKPYLYGFKQNLKWDKLCLGNDFSKIVKQYPQYVLPGDRGKCIGEYPCDCSGLISAYTEVQKSSWEFYNTAVRKEPIARLMLAEPGCILWQRGHVGVYIGNGEYIAEDGSRYGCRKNKVSKASFTHILWIPDIVYEVPKKTKDTKYFKKCSKGCYSIVDGLNEIHENSSLTYRSMIAKINNIRGYVGSADQNMKLLSLLKEGKLIKP